MYILLSFLLLFAIITILILNHPKFGKLPSGEHLERIKQSPHYKNEAFQNQSITPDLTEGENFLSVALYFFFKKSKRVAPKGKIPSIKTDLLNLDINKDVLVWFGHSSYFIQIDKKRILVDPVFCGYASPFSFTAKAFDGSDSYKVEDMPEIDYLFISHDHWDHLDYETIKKLKPKIKNVICSIGTAQHLEYWGYKKEIIIEKDWHQTFNLGTGFTVHTTPCRHFSGRGFKRNKALWQSYVLQTPSMKLFLGGDSGYDKHFAEIGKTHGPFDLAILENGQYDKRWRYIHLLPNEIVKAANELTTKRLLAVHHSKFAIANHDWDEPMIKITANCKMAGLPLLTPKIGELVYLKETSQTFEEWWTEIN